MVCVGTACPVAPVDGTGVATDVPQCRRSCKFIQNPDISQQPLTGKKLFDNYGGIRDILQ